MHVTYQVYTFINIINLSIQIYPYKTELDLPRVRLNGRLNSCLARLMLFISIPFRPFRHFFYRTYYPIFIHVYEDQCSPKRLIKRSVNGKWW